MSSEPDITVTAQVLPQCQHVNSRGHRCRMLAASEHSTLCGYHSHRPARSEPDTAPVAAELLDGIADFSRADSINLFLGNLLKQLAYKRIARPDAIALAYIGQLLLNSLPAMQRESEAERDAAAGRQLLEAVGIGRAARNKEKEPAAETIAPRSDRVQVIWR